MATKQELLELSVKLLKIQLAPVYKEIMDRAIHLSTIGVLVSQKGDDNKTTRRRTRQLFPIDRAIEKAVKDTHLALLGRVGRGANK